MKINKRLFRKSALTSMVAIMVLLTTSCADLWKEQHPGTYYTSNGETVAEYLEGKLKNHGSFTYFKAILQEANLWGQMRTYGEYTCFAPDDSAIQKYIDERRLEAINRGDSAAAARFRDINALLADEELCDTIARTHLFDKVMYASDMNGDGVFEYPNMMDRYMGYYSDSISQIVYDEDNVTPLKAHDGTDSVAPRLVYLINMQAKVMKADDTVQNGVVHKIDRVLRTSNKLIYSIIKEDPQLTLFYQALEDTRLIDSLEANVDKSYPGVDYTWTKQAVIDKAEGMHSHTTSVETDNEVMPEERKFRFTIFAVKDSILEKEYGIKTYPELVTLAESVYPDGAGLPHESRASSINRLISYHILPYFLTYNQFNTCHPDLIKKYNAICKSKDGKIARPIDSEDFFETMLPHSIMRISTPWKSTDPAERLGGIFINRKGIQDVDDDFVEGIRIAESGEYPKGKEDPNIALNGIYHYVDKLLLYDETTRTQTLKCRMRIMSCTLSPDFINSGARGRMDDDYHMVYCFYPNYCKNFDWVEGQTGLFVRYRNSNFGTFNGDELSIMYNYDISLKLPPVPYSGTYEVRIWDNAISGLGEGKADRGVVQFFFHEGDPQVDDTTYWRSWNWEPEDIPIDLRINGDDGRIGWVKDSEYANLPTQKEIDDAIDANDRSMRNRGYMKAMDSYSDLRDNKDCYRKIVCRRYMRDNTDYYLRMRQVFTAGTGVMPFSFIEIVPKDVYEGNEDKH